MNEDKSYITFSSWWDELIVTGIIPFFALVAFNSKIYLKLRASDNQEYRFVGQQKVETDIPTMTVTTANVLESDDDESVTCLPPMAQNINYHGSSSSLTPKIESGRNISYPINNKPISFGNGDQILVKFLLLKFTFI